MLIISQAPTAEELEAETAEAADELGIVEDAPQQDDEGSSASAE